MKAWDGYAECDRKHVAGHPAIMGLIPEVTVARAQLKDEVFMNMALELSRLGT